MTRNLLMGERTMNHTHSLTQPASPHAFTIQFPMPLATATIAPPSRAIRRRRAVMHVIARNSCCIVYDKLSSIIWRQRLAAMSRETAATPVAAAAVSGGSGDAETKNAKSWKTAATAAAEAKSAGGGHGMYWNRGLRVTICPTVLLPTARERERERERDGGREQRDAVRRSDSWDGLRRSYRSAVVVADRWHSGDVNKLYLRLTCALASGIPPIRGAYNYCTVRLRFDGR